MLEKIAGNDWVDKLHIIYLFEADFNFNNNWLWQAVMAQAEAKQHNSW